MDYLFLNALIIVFGISIGAGPLGSFVLWQRLSYFGDTIAHSALLGVILAMMIKTNHIVGILLISLLPSFILIRLRNCYSKDMLFNIISNSSVALALIILSIAPFSGTNITSMLFGDILAIHYYDMLLIYGATVAIVIITIFQWKKWLLMTISKELAVVAQLNVNVLQIEFIVLLSVFIAVSINIVGILLITSLLIIPAATARVLTKTPIQMVVLSSIICFISSICGLLTSFQFDTPTGPSIIVMSTSILILVNVYSYIRNYKLSGQLQNSQ